MNPIDKQQFNRSLPALQRQPELLANSVEHRWQTNGVVSLRCRRASEKGAVKDQRKVPKACQSRLIDDVHFQIQS